MSPVFIVNIIFRARAGYPAGICRLRLLVQVVALTGAPRADSTGRVSVPAWPGLAQGWPSLRSMSDAGCNRRPSFYGHRRSRTATAVGAPAARCLGQRARRRRRTLMS